jgi:hypothetical protein
VLPAWPLDTLYGHALRPTRHTDASRGAAARPGPRQNPTRPLDSAAPPREYPFNATDAPGERVTRVRSPGNHIHPALRAAMPVAVVAALALSLVAALPQSAGEAAGIPCNGADPTVFILQTAALSATPRFTSPPCEPAAQQDVSHSPAEAASRCRWPTPDCSLASADSPVARTRGTPNVSFASRALASSSSTRACAICAHLAALAPALSLEPRDPLVVDSRASSALFGNRTKSTDATLATAFDAREAAEYAFEVTKSLVRQTQIPPLSEPAFRARIAHRMTPKTRPS